MRMHRFLSESHLLALEANRVEIAEGPGYGGWEPLPPKKLVHIKEAIASLVGHEMTVELRRSPQCP